MLLIEGCGPDRFQNGVARDSARTIKEFVSSWPRRYLPYPNSSTMPCRATGPAKSAAGGEVAVKPTLVPGSAVAGPYEAKMAADGFAGCACKP